MDSLPETKTCTKCGVEKSINDFGKYRKNKDGLRHNCKHCRNLKEAEYRKSNWDDIYKRKREWRNNNLEKSRKSARKYAQKYRRENAENLKLKYANDEDYRKTLQARSAKWRKNNPEKNVMKTTRRYAKQKSVHVESFTIQEMLDKWGTNCHICQTPIDLDAPRNCRGDNWQLGLHQEHVIPINDGGEHSLSNVRPAHAICNLRKGH